MWIWVSRILIRILNELSSKMDLNYATTSDMAQQHRRPFEPLPKEWSFDGRPVDEEGNLRLRNLLLFRVTCWYQHPVIATD